MRKTLPYLVGTCLLLSCLAAAMQSPKPAPEQPESKSSSEGRKVFTDSVTPLPAVGNLGPRGLRINAARPKDQEQKMDLLFALAIPKADQDDLEARVAKGEIISPKEMSAKYSVKPADQEKLLKWLKDQGFEITRTTADRTSVYARATVAQIEKNLQVKMVRVTRNGVDYTAAQNAPSLPEDVGAGVRAIIGLQPFRQMHRQNIRVRPQQSAEIKLARVQSLGPTGANVPPFFVSEILKAYGADNLGVSGAGEKIAILIDTFPVDSDLQGFWQANGLPVKLSQVEKINVKEATLPGQEGEETLDVEWTTGVAPGATVRVYATSSLAFVDLDLGLDQIYADATAPGSSIHQLSISLGLGETYMGGPLGEVATQHQKFLRLAAVGVNVFVSSGDGGSTPDQTGHSQGGPLQAEYESSDTSVVAVGGTSLVLNRTDGSVAAETGWSGGGGGVSIYFPRPRWQNVEVFGMPQVTMRCVPDVSMAADPEFGAYVFYQGKMQQYGGTSWSAPVWAGLCALLNEARRNAHMQPLPFLNPLIYPLLGSASFRDITEGSNGVDHKYDAGPGYDLVTGIGVPNTRILMRVLTHPSALPSALDPPPPAIVRPASSNRITPLIFSTRAAFGVEDDIERIKSIFSNAEDALRTSHPQIRFEPTTIGKGIRDKDELFTLIHGAMVDESTTLFCYCKLHGEVDPSGEHVLYLDGTDAPVTRKELLKELDQLGDARLTILITDSCAQVRRLPARAGVAGVVFPKKLFLDLFVNSSGRVDINSAAIGQRAWMDLEGSLFTRAFARMLSPKAPDLIDKLYGRIDKNGNGRYAWREIFPVLVSDTEAAFLALKSGVLGDNKPHALEEQPKQTPTAFSALPGEP